MHDPRSYKPTRFATTAGCDTPIQSTRKETNPKEKQPTENYNPAPWFDRAVSPKERTTSKEKHASRSSYPVVIIGAGLAGCSLAWSLNRAGVSVTLLDAGDTVASAASGNTRAICRPQLNRNNPQFNLFYETAFHLTLQRVADLKTRGYTIEHSCKGLLQLLEDQGEWPENKCATPVDAKIASELAGIKLHTDALYFPRGGWVNARDYCRALIADSPRTRFLGQREVIAKTCHRGQWKLTVKHTPSKTIKQLHSNRVVLACGPGIKTLCPTLLKELHVTMSTSTGQTTSCQHDDLGPTPRLTITGKKYLIPEERFYTVGATHQRNISSVIPRHSDDLENLQALAAIDPTLTDHLSIVNHWRSTRISTPDRLPIVGSSPDGRYYRQAYRDLRHGPRHRNWPGAHDLSGLYLFTGLGSRGVVSAALCADLLTRQITEKEDYQPDPSPHTIYNVANINQDSIRSFEHILHPARFLIRACRKGLC